MPLVFLLAFIFFTFQLRSTAAHNTKALTSDILQQARANAGDERVLELQKLKEAAERSREDEPEFDDDEQESEKDFFGYASPRLYFEKMLTVHCEGGNVKQYHAHVDAGIDIDARDPETGESCLIKAARSGHSEIVEDALQERDADLNLQGFDNVTALIAAAEAGHVGILRDLLSASEGGLDGAGKKRKKKKKPKKKMTKEEKTSMKNRRREKRKKNPRPRPKLVWSYTSHGRRSAVMAAVLSGHENAWRIVESLAKAGTPHLSLKDVYGMSPLHIAAREGQADVVRSLCRHGVHMNSRVGRSFHGMTEGETERQLLETAEQEVADSKPGTGGLSKHDKKRRKEARSFADRGVTALQIALEKRRDDVVDYLLFHADEDRATIPPASPDSPSAAIADSRNSASASALTSKTTPESTESRLNVEIAAGVCSGDQDDDEGGRHGLRDFSSIDVTLSDRMNLGPLMAAAVQGNVTVVRRLLELGADPNQQAEGSGDTSLLRTAFFGHVETSEVLLNAGASVNLPDAQGLTPLMKASWYNRAEVVQVLLRHGAVSSIYRKSKHGDTAISKAKEWGKDEVVSILEAAAAKFDETDPLRHRRENRQQRRAQEDRVAPPQHTEL